MTLQVYWPSSGCLCFHLSGFGDLECHAPVTPESAILRRHLQSPDLIALVPLALKGVPYRAKPAAQLLSDNLMLRESVIGRSIHRH